MNTDDQNIFYSSISKYYSSIFPYNPKQLSFIESEVNIQGQKILDIGCATGELANQLALKGAKVTGIDVNHDLLLEAQNKIHQNLQFQFGDMLNLYEDFNREEFDIILCFGNTLVHLQTVELVEKMLKGVFRSLKPGGKFLLQILNYDYILEQKINELPLIESDKIRFKRNYFFGDGNPLIRFSTELYIKKEEKTETNETSLLALQSSTLKILLLKSGFSQVSFYSGFDHGSFGGNHLPLVAGCVKE